MREKGKIWKREEGMRVKSTRAGEVFEGCKRKGKQTPLKPDSGNGTKLKKRVKNRHREKREARLLRILYWE